MFEQGAGRVDLIQSWKILKAYKPQGNLPPPTFNMLSTVYYSNTVTTLHRLHGLSVHVALLFSAALSHWYADDCERYNP